MLKKIINIVDVDEIHRKVTLFNFIHFSFMKKEYNKRRKEISSTFNYYKKHNIDITTYPKATGILREVQEAGLELMKEFDYVCKTANFDYWIDFGTLLGAVRHKGFIPWDDDVDVSMPREFYNQIIEVFNLNKRNDRMRARYKRFCDKTPNYFIRIEYIDTPLVMDVFPYDFYGEVLTEEQRNERNEQLKRLRQNELNIPVSREGLSDEEMKVKIEAFRHKILVNGYHTKESKTDLLWGVDFNHNWKQWFYSYDTIYPLKKISFEGLEFNCPNNPDKYLKTVYGDYMSYPKDVKNVHSICRLTKEQLIQIKTYIGKE